MDSKEFAHRIAEIIFSKKGYEVILMNLKQLTTFADYFVICSADSDTQVKAIADEIDKTLKEQGIKCWHKEGYQALRWVLLDYVDVVVHIFKKEVREYYSLERLWGDADVEKISDQIEKQAKS